MAKPHFTPVSKEMREACYDAIYKNRASDVKELQNSAGRYDNTVYDIYTEKWDKVLEVLAECPSAEEISTMLTDVGMDLSAFEKMYGKQKIQNAVWFAKDLKDRYSVLWLYYDLFFDESEADKIGKSL